MTREEAIINLKLSQNRIGGIKKEEWNALQMAIKALSADAEEAVLNKMLEEEMIILPQDYVKVVLCKDCKWHMNDYMGEWCGKLREHPGMKANDFCSCGERREE